MSDRKGSIRRRGPDPPSPHRLVEGGCAVLSRTRWLVTALTIGLLAPLLAVPASASGAYDDTLDLTFPVPDLDQRHFLDDYHFDRGGGTRQHKATDIGSPNAYGLPVHAAMGGRITQLTGADGNPPSYGYMIRVAGDDGRDYVYIHLGRQSGPPSEAYAPGLQRGDRVERGQHLGFVGHSGNASEAFPHLHFEIHDEGITDPYGTHRRNPYASLKAALGRGDLPDGPRFADVANGHAHAAAIAAIAKAGITEGCTVGRFCPTRTVTRGQMATFLARALELPNGQASGFDDVPASHPHAGSIAAVAEAGIAQGDGNGRFDPDVAVRRDQMATLLAAALELTPSEQATFTDVPPSSVHAAAIAALAEAGIALGNGDGTYRPSRPIDRGQMASFLKRSFLS
jgi:hypothetical protein